MPNTAVSAVPVTEGIKYAGSKLKLIPQILELVDSTSAKSVFDGFSGTTRVSQALASNGLRVHSNDIADWSAVFAECYLKNDRDEDFFVPLIDHLNSLEGKDGWFSENYGGIADHKRSDTQDGKKKPFQIHNMRKLDAIREEIDELPINYTEKCVLITSLILALDRVDSTLGHYASYLREWSPRSYDTLKLRVPRLIKGYRNHKVTKADAIEEAAETDCDLSYFDPPYGSNNEKMPPSRVRYNSYYHFWRTVVLNDQPDLFGKAARRTDSSDKVTGSDFEEFRRNDNGRFKAVQAIESLIENAATPFIILSYSSKGRATRDELQESINRKAKLRDVLEIDYRSNVMRNMRWTNEWTEPKEKQNQEYLFLLEKR